jgi:hypothetical protein
VEKNDFISFFFTSEGECWDTTAPLFYGRKNRVTHDFYKTKRPRELTEIASKNGGSVPKAGFKKE